MRIWPLNTGAWLCRICKPEHEFERAYSEIQFRGTYCPSRSVRLAERQCQAAMQQLFGVEFRKRRFKAMRGVGGDPLELDLFSDDPRLGKKLAIEHNGLQHYTPVRFGNQTKAEAEVRFERQKEHDRRRREYCARAGIVLIEIPQLGTVTKLDRLKAFIKAECVRREVVLPTNFDDTELDLRSCVLTTEEERRWREVIHLVKITGCKLRTRCYPGSHGRLDMTCRNGHPRNPTVTQFLGEYECRACWLNSVRVPLAVVALDPKRCKGPLGRSFVVASYEAAAKATGTTADNIRITAKGRGQTSNGYGFAELTPEQAEEFRRIPHKLEAFCQQRWPNAHDFDRHAKQRQMRSKPVIRSDGRVFRAAVAAATELKVTKTAVLIAIWKRQRCRKFHFAQVSREQFEAFSRDGSLAIEYCRKLWPESLQQGSKGWSTRSRVAST